MSCTLCFASFHNIIILASRRICYLFQSLPTYKGLTNMTLSFIFLTILSFLFVAIQYCKSYLHSGHLVSLLQDSEKATVYIFVIVPFLSHKFQNFHILFLHNSWFSILFIPSFLNKLNASIVTNPSLHQNRDF